MATTTLATLLTNSSTRRVVDVDDDQNRLSRLPPITDSISTIHAFISKWDPHSSLSSRFLRATTHLHSYLLHLAASPARSSRNELMRTNSLLQSAMNCLDQELRNHLLSISDVHTLTDTISTVRSIVETMLSTGYGEECLTTYQSIRRAAVMSQLNQLGFDLYANRTRKLRKLKWEVLDNWIQSWIDALQKAVRSVFFHEKQLSDKIFGASAQSVHDSVFATIVSDIAGTFFSFPEIVCKHVKRVPERLFRLLDLYESLSDLIPDIESVFESEPVSSVRTKVMSSLTKLSVSIQTILYEFERSIQKDTTKTQTAPGGQVLALTRYVMNYLLSLSDYEAPLRVILADVPQVSDASSIQSFDSDDRYGSPVSVRISWLLLVLLRKLESKAEKYNDVALSYLFLVNNVYYMAKKVDISTLKESLGDEWVAVHMTKVRRYMEGHVRSGWAHVSAALPVKDEETVERVREFEMLFQKVLKEREGWVIVDPVLRNEVRLLVESMLVPAYRGWYQVYRGKMEVRFAPEDVRNQVFGLYEVSRSGSVSGSGSGSGSGKLLRRLGCYLPQQGDMSVRLQTEGAKALAGEFSLRYPITYDLQQHHELSLRHQIQNFD
ncbi:exocyst complex component EXO70A1-like protein [Carex littledalei]|uniref:Exocyst subunit Exo70 family protein n=1 Tax=Carex littledalei TaxID=544730 RepID=A0A833R5A0_9POAL|nr:exocyst complex component EXO70A1-like protein [Carex littledalei]